MYIQPDKRINGLEYTEDTVGAMPLPQAPFTSLTHKRIHAIAGTSSETSTDSQKHSEMIRVLNPSASYLYVNTDQ